MNSSDFDRVEILDEMLALAERLGSLCSLSSGEAELYRLIREVHGSEEHQSLVDSVQSLKKPDVSAMFYKDYGQRIGERMQAQWGKGSKEMVIDAIEASAAGFYYVMGRYTKKNGDPGGVGATVMLKMLSSWVTC